MRLLQDELDNIYQEEKNKMEENNIPTSTSDRDMCWASIRKHKAQLMKIVEAEKQFSFFDLILFFQCVTLIIVDITLYEKDFSDVDRESKELLNDNSVADNLLQIIKEMDYWKRVEDKNLSTEDQLKAVEDLRKNVWRHISYKKDELIKLMQSFPLINNKDDYILIMHCISVVIMELVSREKELELLGIDNIIED